MFAQVSTEWSVHIINTLLYIVILVLSYKLWRKSGEDVSSVSLGTLALHGLVFNAVYWYRLLTWESCPPVCGLQTWAIIIRMHALLSIATVMLYRMMKES